MLVAAVGFVLPVAIYRDRNTLRAMNILRILVGVVKIVILAVVQTVFFFLPTVAGNYYEMTIYPGTGNPIIYTVLGISSGAIGLMLVIQLYRILRITMTASELKWTAVLILLLYALYAFGTFGVEMAYFFLSPLLLFAIGIRLRYTLLVLGIGVVGLFPLITASGIETISMVFTAVGIFVPSYSIMITVLFVSIPFIMHFASTFVKPDEAV
jgi:hypothetical protein